MPNFRFTTDRAAGHAAAADGLYRDLGVGVRDLACLLLADLSPHRYLD
ncbi:hypothetical protein [Candidatus Vondammii sp. HM_W22]|nr:hypothetical protein [Candidatus Vondammii sp. HM_W22]